MRIAAGVMAATLFAFAAVQLNDPDPLGWTAIYAAAAIVSLAFSARLQVRIPAIGLALLAAVWALTLLPEAGKLSNVSEQMDIMRPEIEVARELGGLLIVVAWMSALALQTTRSSESMRPSRT